MLQIVQQHLDLERERERGGEGERERGREGERERGRERERTRENLACHTVAYFPHSDLSQSF